MLPFLDRLPTGLQLPQSLRDWPLARRGGGRAAPGGAERLHLALGPRGPGGGRGGWPSVPPGPAPPRGGECGRRRAATSGGACVFWVRPGSGGAGVAAPAPLSCAQKRETQTRSRAGTRDADLGRWAHTVLGLSRSLRRWKAFLNKLSVRTT